MVEESKNEEHLLIDNVLNFVIKHANREIEGMFQMGKKPQFYNKEFAYDLGD